MKITRRSALLAGVSASVFATEIAMGAQFPLDPAKDDASRKLLVRMLRVMFPHKKFPDGPYERTADTIFASAAQSTAGKVNLAASLGELQASGFDKLDDAAALDYLKSIEASPFFQLVRGAAVNKLYDDPEIWAILGYEGPSFDKGGYINRGFNDLDWLPDPRVEEYDEAEAIKAGAKK